MLTTIRKMLPIFKSHYSLGKSILTIDPKKKKHGPDSIIDICEENKLKTLILVEDCLTGFMSSVHACNAANIQLIFGLRMTCCNSVTEEDVESDHKIVLFAKNDAGCKLLNRIYSQAQTVFGGKVDFAYLNSVWTDDLDLTIPFYDSFLHKNCLELSCCVPDFSQITPSFFYEENGLPFDGLLKDIVLKNSKSPPFSITKVKSIYYKQREDYKALQTYKILCNRSFGKPKNLGRPELPHFGSQEFCWESYCNEK
jgi:DNA polymerase III alpha subunit